MPRIHGTLSQLLKRNDVTVLEGEGDGGLLRPSPATPVTPTSPCTANFSNLYITSWGSEHFLTLVRDPQRGPDAFFYQFEFKEENQWMRAVGAAYLVSDNQLNLLDADSSEGELRLNKGKCKCGKSKSELVLYKARPSAVEGPHLAVTLAKLRLSSVAERDQVIPCRRLRK